MTLWLGAMGLCQTGNPFTEQPMFRMTKEGLIIGFIVGIIFVITYKGKKEDQSESNNNIDNNNKQNHE
jgi:uncharacterized membrane-anchored protein YhcB (DUF1043 family)